MGEAIARNLQAILLGKDETSQQYIFRVWHACAAHLFFYSRTSGEALYEREKQYGMEHMFFFMTREHLALARRLWIVWYRGGDWSYGAPGASTYRPYGNSGVLDDIAEIIGYRRPDPEADERYTLEEKRYLERLHHEMHLVVQIILHTGQMKPGVYKKPQLGKDWGACADLNQEPELVLVSSPDQVPQPLYMCSQLPLARWMGLEDW